jgi:hypothetical protein
MRRTLFALAPIMLVVSSAAGQDGLSSPSLTARQSTQLLSTWANPEPAVSKGSGNLPFCPPKTCLYYAGDNDTTTPNANGLFDFENPGIGISNAEVWVGVKPKKNAVVTGTSGNYYTNTTVIGINPILVAFRKDITWGHGGTRICTGTTGGNASVRAYGTPDFGLNSENYWVKKFNKPCRLPAKKKAYVLEVPQYNDSSTVGYLEDDDGAHANKHGWKEDTYDDYFNSTSFGEVYNMAHTACGDIGCSGFSIALNGVE